MSAPLASGTVISYPIPAYQNLPIRADFYAPSRFVIQSIVLGIVTSVTATGAMNYVIGQEIRLLVPPNFGSYQLNNRTGFVVGVPTSNSVIIDIDSSQNVDAFISSSGIEQAQILPIGDVNLGVTNSQGRINNGTFIPGSFINISPE